MLRPRATPEAPSDERRWRMPAAPDPARPAPDAPGAPGEAVEVSRRALLVAAGFSVAAAASGCRRAEVRRTATTVQPPEHLVPGRPLWYAATCGGCPAGCGILVKERDGRPIKIEGNPEHPVSRGGVCAVGQAQVIALYDERRLREPREGGRPVSWEAVDRRVAEGLAAARASGGVRLLTGTVTGPSTRAAVAAFLAANPGARHVAYDPLSASAILDAHARTHGVRALPRYRFEAADLVVGVEADFLGTWISPVEFTRARAAARSPAREGGRLARHVQFESAFTVTGSNADRRHRIAPWGAGPLLAHLAARVAARAGEPAPAAPAEPPPVPGAVLDALADALWEARTRSLLVCGSNDVGLQLLANRVNHLLDAYGNTLDLAAPSFQRGGDDAAFRGLLEDLEAGRVGALLVAGVNPVADAPGGQRFREALRRAPLSVVLAEREDETTAAATLVLPAPHALECWDDGEPVAGLVTLSQPAVAPFGAARTLRECLAAWTGRAGADPDLVRAAWGESVHPRQAGEPSFERFWRRAVQDGFARVAVPPAPPPPFDPSAVPGAVPGPRRPEGGRLSLVLHPTVAMLDGRHAQNPWLQELPDPVTKLVWGNAASLSAETAASLGVSDGDLVRVEGADGAAMELPALVQPGLADGTVAVPLGYGRRGTDRFAEVGPDWLHRRPTVEAGGAVGASASPFLAFAGGTFAYGGAPVTVRKAGPREDLALSQTYAWQDLPPETAPRSGPKRDAIRETTPEALRAPPAHGAGGAHGTAGPGGGGHGGEPAASLWAGAHAYPGPRWGMVIDLSACTGCSACVVSCQAENNIPVVGKDEVRRRRSLQWMRIDRYYADVPGAPGEVDTAHQPMLCQHCGNAPCESVCPVLATVHDAEGLNSQVYNRCVGTRYCANNCPYKARRFNWFAYERGGPTAELALNPDVTVRSRGVMEKCSMCVQRLHEARAEARRRGVAVADGEVRTACQQSCPAGAIVFGDLNDPASAVAKARGDARHYRVLAELNVDPAVGYLAKVRARPDAKEAEHHG